MDNYCRLLNAQNLIAIKCNISKELISWVKVKSVIIVQFNFNKCHVQIHHAGVVLLITLNFLMNKELKYNAKFVKRFFITKTVEIVNMEISWKKKSL